MRPVILPEHKLVFCPIPKTGTTGYLRLLRWLDNQPNWEELPYMSKFNVKGHMANLTRLENIPAKDAANILFDSTWTKIAVVRDPVDRLISGYVNKLKNPRLTNLKIIGNLQLTTKNFRNISFEDFLTRLEPTLMGHADWEDEHWQRQSRVCGLERFKSFYHYLFYLPADKEKHPEVTKGILEVIARTSPKHVNVSQFPLSLPFRASNHTLADLNEEVCKKAQRLYAGDYELFGMPRPTCLPQFPYVLWPEVSV
eukprot:Skav236537  [mRNA]  locus=scaffold1774:45238:45999:+ [translate_table: standard]